MYLCRRCFISVLALWRIKISLCLWEEREREDGEGRSVCRRKKKKKKMREFFFPLFLSLDGFFRAQAQLQHRLEWQKKTTKTSKAKCDKKVRFTSWRQPLQTSCCEVKNISPPHLCSSSLTSSLIRKPHCGLSLACVRQRVKTCVDTHNCGRASSKNIYIPTYISYLISAFQALYYK